jgi:hypothetical protein
MASSSSSMTKLSQGKTTMSLRGLYAESTPGMPAVGAHFMTVTVTSKTPSSFFIEQR